jgi:putative membrane-bound dehydrogenase-like protein
MWYDGSLYVATPPSIWKLTDTDGDGVADLREEWFQGKTLTGCANDLHGPYRGPDGWIYWCKGAFAEQTYDRPGKPPLVTRASHIFRCRPDGTGIEPVMTGGMDNPVDVAFTPGGERIFTTTFFQHPGGGQRDGLIHAIYGGVYGKVHSVIEDHQRTGDVMPVLTHLGAAAPCGLTRLETAAWGAEYQDNLFAALFNMQKVTRHVLEPVGATFTTRDEDFLVSNNRDFHPTDVLEDADGSLIVVDTGGWYKLCCPTSQLWKPDVLGAIYRVRPTSAPKAIDPRGLRLPWLQMSPEELAELLGDARPAVRNRAIHEMGKRGEEAIAVLSRVVDEGSSPEARCNAVWCLTRIDHPGARAAARRALSDSVATVRQAAIHSVSVTRDAAAVPRLVTLLRSDNEHNARAAAEALGRLGEPAAVPALLQAAAQPHDRALEHSLTFALIEIADPKATAAGLDSESPGTIRAALLAIDQMYGGGLDPNVVTPLLASTDPVLKQTASWIVGRRPEWGAEVAGFFQGRLESPGLNPDEHTDLSRQLARLGRSPAIQELLAACALNASLSHDSRRTVLLAMRDSGMAETPPAWISALAGVLAGADRPLAYEAVSVARKLRVQPTDAGALAAAILDVARSKQTPASVRLEALAALPGGLAVVDPETFAFLQESLELQQPVDVRSAAADVLAAAQLSASQFEALTASLKTAGPLEIGRLLACYDRCSDAAVGQKLVSALLESRARAALQLAVLEPLLAKFGDSLQPKAEELVAAIRADTAEQIHQINDIMSVVEDGDVRRGQAVFNSTKAACSTCHAIGYLGGDVGPDLTRIGKIRSDRDLLEAIVFPSASFVRSYEPVAVATDDGKVYNGLVRNESPDEIVLATGPNEEVRLRRDAVEEIHPSTVSVMPAGLDQQLTHEELADLVAFLRASR